VTQNPLVDALNRELSDAGPALAGNDDLLRGVLAGCGDCIKVLDLDGRLQFMSEGGKRVMEVEDFSALKGCPWPDLWAGEGNAQAAVAVAAAREGRTSHFRNAANTAKGNPRYWDVQVSPIFGEGQKPAYLLSISRDITEEHQLSEKRKKDAERQKFLAEELIHRVKNTLATVISISNQTFRDEIHKDARQAFGKRIQTLNDAYNVLTELNWSAVSLEAIVKAAVAPFQASEGRFAIEGPQYDLQPDQALTMALALNELGTNAAKYGALSAPAGHVGIFWAVKPLEGRSAFQFEWRETGGPPVTPPARSGFGSRLIKSVLAQDFKGAVELRYEPTGLVCLLTA
jgi:two-component sensor histidine kinase